MSSLNDHFVPVEGQPGTYSRRLLGSEAFYDGLHLAFNGSAECIMGFTFETALSHDRLEAQVKDALMKLRFHSPLFSCSIVSHPENPFLRSWIYTCAKDYQEAASWAKSTLHVIHGPVDPESFILKTSHSRLPYVHPHGHSQHFALYLLPQSPEDTCALFMHGSHSLMDAFPTIESESRILRWTAEYDEATSASTLQWGEEWKNLTPGPISLTASPRSGYEEGSSALLQKYDKIVFNGNPKTHSLKPQRPMATGYPEAVRVHRTLDREVANRMFKRLKAAGRGVTNLFEAAMILAMFRNNPIPEEETKVAHVTLDSTVVSMSRHYAGRYKNDPPFVSCLVYIPLSVPYSIFPRGGSLTEQLEAIMTSLEEQYSQWQQEPYLRYLNVAREFVPLPETAVTTTNPYAQAISSLGLVDTRMPPVLKDKDGKEVLRVKELKFGHRWLTDRTATHIWTFDGVFHLQIQGSNVWDETYLSNFVDEILRIALAFGDDVGGPSVSGPQSKTIPSALTNGGDAHYVQARRHGGVGVVTICRPKVRNALSGAMIKKLLAALVSFDENPEVGAIIITGSDNVFSSGVDIKELSGLSFVSAYQANFLQDLSKGVHSVRKPVIAAVNGPALGGGCELALLCDIIVAGENAVFGFPEIKIGTIPGGGGTQRLIRAIGKAKAMHLVLTGGLLSAHDAAVAGLVAKVYPNDTVLKEALSLGHTIASYSKPIVAIAKEAVKHAEDTTLEAGSRMESRLYYSTFGTDDFKEGTTAFLKKRVPVWKDS